jgi:hypothetical protein
VVMADKPETLALLQKDSSHLEQSLQQAGINTNGGTMSFNLRDQQAQQSSQQDRKRFSRQDIGGDATAAISLNTLPDNSIISDTRVNYHA